MFTKKMYSMILLFVFCFISIAAPIQTAHAAAIDDIVKTLGTSTMSTVDANAGGSNVFEKLFSFIFDMLLGPLLNLGGGGAKSSSGSSSGSVKVTPLPPSGPIQDTGTLQGKVIVVDPGHGGSNPGAVANGTQEADNNLAVGLKLRDKLVQAGAKVILTRTSDQTVAPEGSSLGQELQARVDIAELNHADMFVSVHSNENPDASIEGAMTFYPSGKSQKLALEVQSTLIKETSATDKGVSPATFYVLRNTTMPSILVEMGFVSNTQEAARLASDSYRGKVAQGIFNGIVKYFNAAN